MILFEKFGSDYDEIVKLIDRFTLWLYGKKASWWNSKKVQKEVAEANPYSRSTLHLEVQQDPHY